MQLQIGSLGITLSIKKRLSAVPAKRPRQMTALLVVAVLVAVGLFSVAARAEQTGSSPESGTTSYLKALSTSLTGLGYGSDTDSPDWGTMWNRIKTAANWVPNGTAAAGDVLSGKNFYNTTRSAVNGTYNAASLSAATVKNGTSFGVGLTGAYPSVSNPLPGDTAATDAAAGNVWNGQEAWTKAGALITGTYPNPGGCSTQAFSDNSGSATQANNCTSAVTWSAASSPISGDDDSVGGHDPRTNLTWSQLVTVTAGAPAFSAFGGSSFSWDASGSNNVTVGSLTAVQICSSFGNGWHLPSQKDFMQGYIDGSRFNLGHTGGSFWSSTQDGGGNAYTIIFNTGVTATSAETNTTSVRCVR